MIQEKDLEEDLIEDPEEDPEGDSEENLDEDIEEDRDEDPKDKPKGKVWEDHIEVSKAISNIYNPIYIEVIDISIECVPDESLEYHQGHIMMGMMMMMML